MLTAVILASTLAISPRFELLAGLVDDQALLQSSGRELQPFKIIRAIAGVDVTIDDKWSATFESVLIGDEAKREDGNAVYQDYYKNYGADLLYYGDYPVRSAFLQFKFSDTQTIRFGRQVNPYGYTLDGTYLHRHDAPHALYLDKEILAGITYTYENQSVILSAAVLSGRGRPDSDYNYFLNGQTDPNTKDNNTPIIEFTAEYAGIYTGYHRNKTGSAPGVINAGKYNDNRLNIGYSKQWHDLFIHAQYSSYQIGLTESGDQGQYSGSKDITKTGYFYTVSYKGFQYTNENLDRIDSLVYQNYGETDSKEVSHIYSYNYKMIQIFYRTIENDFPELSNIKSTDESFKFGILIHEEF